MPDWKSHVFLAIPNADETAFLFLPGDEQKWRLPLYAVKSTMFNMYLLQRQLHQDFQAELTVLRWIGNQKEESPEMNYYWAIALIENHQADFLIPEGARWFDAQALKSLPLVDEWQREYLVATLKSLSKEEAPAIRPAWFRKGWFQKARQWVETELTNHGYQRTSEIEQLKHWSLSALFRVETTQGNVYFKIANRFPLFANEPQIIQNLSQLFPEYVPSPIAIHAEERWMLMADFGAMVADSNSNENKAMRLRMARDYARFQQKTAKPEMLERLEASGCFNRRIRVLEQQIAGMYLDKASYASLTAEELSAWQASHSQLIALCQALAAYKIPDTLVHGDFHSGNVAIRENDFLIFDWTDACISHPFFDLPIFLDFDGGEDVEEIRQAYLAEWQAYEPAENLEKAYHLAETAAMLHQIISYQGIHNGVEAEQQADWAGSVVYFIRKIIKALPELGLP